MKKNSLLLLLALLTCGMAISAQQKPDAPVFKVETSITIDKKVFKPGDKIPLKIVCTYPSETHQAGSWRLFAYLPEVPEEFEKMPNFKVTHRKDKRWSSVDAKQGFWFPAKQRKNKEFQVTIDTQGWPEGDYRMNIQITFQPVVKGEKYLYRAGKFVFTLEK